VQTKNNHRQSRKDVFIHSLLRVGISGSILFADVATIPDDARPECAEPYRAAPPFFLFCWKQNASFQSSPSQET
jgi:hypothetical protein